MSEDLWAVHVRGPDDILAMPSREVAYHHAHKLNELFVKDRDGDDLTIWASPEPWQGTRDSHAEAMQRNGLWLLARKESA